MILSVDESCQIALEVFDKALEVLLGNEEGVPCYLVKACMFNNKTVLMNKLLNCTEKVNFGNGKFPDQFYSLFDPIIDAKDVRLCRKGFTDLNKVLKNIDSFHFIEYAYS